MRQWINICENAQDDPVDGFIAAAMRAKTFTRLRKTKGPVWLIHFSADAREIAAHGFLHGSSLEACMTASHGAGSGRVGYNFAYLAKDQSSIMGVTSFAYGAALSGAVIFRAEAAVMAHRDGFTQAVFWGPAALHPMIVIETTPEDEALVEELDWKIVAKDGAEFDGPTGDIWQVIRAATRT